MNFKENDWTHLVQSHVHADEARELLWSKLIIDCELIWLEPFARKSSWNTMKVMNNDEGHKLWVSVNSFH